MTTATVHTVLIFLPVEQFLMIDQDKTTCSSIPKYRQRMNSKGDNVYYMDTTTTWNVYTKYPVSDEIKQAIEESINSAGFLCTFPDVELSSNHCQVCRAIKPMCKCKPTMTMKRESK